MRELSSADNKQLNELVRKCVHCGFCNATCPSYKILGNELDGPRGRIHLIADLLNGETNDEVIREHLDSCLTCRNCETTCPSGVEYSKIIALGRELVSVKFGRPLLGKVQRKLLATLLSSPALVTRVFGFVSLAHRILPASVRAAIPKRTKPLPLLDTSTCTRKVALLEGCVQPGLSPNTNRAMHNLLSRLGIATIPLEVSACCGALPHHSDRQKLARKLALSIIDAAGRKFGEGCEALVMTSSACVLEMQEYPRLLRNDVVGVRKAQPFSERVADLSSIITPEAVANLGIRARASVAFHPPCTLQHGQGAERASAIDAILEAAGLELVPIADRHLCCGSAGTFSIMQPQLAEKLREEKVVNLTRAKPDYLATANIGCQVFLQQAMPEQQPVWHWVELLEYLANVADPKY